MDREKQKTCNSKMAVYFWNSEDIMSIDNFRKFHRNNPKVFDMVLKYAYKQKDKGRTHYSIEIIMNVIRYHVDLDTVGDQFKNQQ